MSLVLLGTIVIIKLKFLIVVKFKLDRKDERKIMPVFWVVYVKFYLFRKINFHFILN